MGKHLVQAVPIMNTFQCLAGKADSIANNNFIVNNYISFNAVNAVSILAAGCSLFLLFLALPFYTHEKFLV